MVAAHRLASGLGRALGSGGKWRRRRWRGERGGKAAVVQLGQLGPTGGGGQPRELGWRGSGAKGERQQWSGNLGGAQRGNSAASDGSSVRRHAGFFVEQRGKEKGRGKWGSRPRRAEEGGPVDVRAEWGPDRQWCAPGGGGRRSGAVA
jgi:hypothetical protein